MDHHRAGPELLGAGARVGDRRGAVHAGRLRRVDVELGAFDDAHAVELPLGGFVLVGHGRSLVCGAHCIQVHHNSNQALNRLHELSGTTIERAVVASHPCLPLPRAAADESVERGEHPDDENSKFALLARSSNQPLTRCQA